MLFSKETLYDLITATSPDLITDDWQKKDRARVLTYSLKNPRLQMLKIELLPELNETY